MTTDRVSLEILSNKSCAIAEEMGLTLQRAGRTIYVKETADFATGLMSLDGELFGYPRKIGVIGFVGLNGEPTIKAIQTFNPGDIIITNDPYGTKGLSTHLPDLNLIKPYFHDGRLVCFGWCFIHSADIGGKVPSSISTSNTEIFQEGLRLPPVKLIARGEVNQEILDIYRANCRTPDLNWGDIRAMIACLSVGEKRVQELVDEYGVDKFIQSQEDILAYSESVSRDALRKIPDGRYKFSDYLDDDLASGIPVRIQVELTADDGRIAVDFSGTDVCTVGPLNIATGGGVHPWLVLKLVGLAQSYAPDLHFSAGILRNMTVNAPERTVVNAEFPAAVGVRSATGLRISDAINGALAQATGGLVGASPAGSAVPIVFVEAEPGGGDTKVSVIQFAVGGTGARNGADGIDGRDPGLSSMANNPIEIIESEASVRILEYGLRPDSAGPGCYRGGCGQRFIFRVEADDCVILARGIERAHFQPWGLNGGGAGSGFEIYRSSAGGARERIGKIDTLEVSRGDIIEILTPGGGGYGHPLDRDIDAVRSDVASGLISPEAARSQYGVAIDEGGATAQALPVRGAPRGTHDPIFVLGALRAAWDQAIPAAVLDQLTEKLRSLPQQERNAKRRRFFELLDPRLLERDAGNLSDILSSLNPDAVPEALEHILSTP